MGRKMKKSALSAVAVAEVDGDEPPVEASRDVVPPPSLEADNGDEQLAKAAPVEEESREASSEAEAAKLKALNAMLVKELMERRGQVAMLSARVEELSIAAGTEEEDAAQKSLSDAEATAVRESDASSGDSAAAIAVELEGAQEAEVATESKNVPELEASVAELAGKITELSAERGELQKQLGEMTSSARRVQAQMAEVEGNFNDYKKNTERYKQDIEQKLEGKSGELEVLRSEKAQVEAKLCSSEAELSAAVSRNRELEAEVEASKAKLAAARREVEKFRLKVADVGNKCTKEVTEAERLKVEIDKMMTIKKAAVSAHAAEKTKLERQSDGLKRKLDLIQANKDAALSIVNEKEAEATNLRAELERLRTSIAKLRVLSDEQTANSSCLQDEKDKVLKAFSEEKAEGDKLRLIIAELESCNGEKNREIGVLKAEVEDKKGNINGLSREIEQLQLAVAEAQQSAKSGVWTWLCPATTTVIAAASFAYATRSR